MELSIRASTASCNILFSLRQITSGAFNSISCFNRLLRLIIRRYRSLRSEVANRPPSKATIGRKSGGITGITVKIIHSGRKLLLAKFLKNRKRLIIFSFLESIAPLSSASKLWMVLSKSILAKSSRIASDPIPAVKICPYFKLKFW